MKKLLPPALLALALFAVPRPSEAGTFGLFPHWGCGGCCGCNVCIRPYNAFSPVVSGTLYLDGMFPFSSAPMYGPGGPWPKHGCPQLNYSGNACCANNPVTDGSMMGPNLQQPAPAAGNAPVHTVSGKPMTPNYGQGYGYGYGYNPYGYYPYPYAMPYGYYPMPYGYYPPAYGYNPAAYGSYQNGPMVPLGTANQPARSAGGY